MNTKQTLCDTCTCCPKCRSSVLPYHNRSISSLRAAFGSLNLVTTQSKCVRRHKKSLHFCKALISATQTVMLLYESLPGIMKRLNQKVLAIFKKKVRSLNGER